MRTPIVSGKDLVKALHKQGFRIVARRGSHVRMKRRRKGQPTRVTVIPMHKELAPGTLHAIRRQCGWSREEFLRVLGRTP